MFFKRQHHLENVEHKEVLIQASKKKLATRVDADLVKLNKLNKILGNGIALYVTSAVGKHE